MGDFDIERVGGIQSNGSLIYDKCSTHSGTQGAYFMDINISGHESGNGDDLGAPIYAIANGHIVSAGWDNSGFGNSVILKTDAGVFFRYAHLSVISVYLRQTVAQDTLIGMMGTTDTSTGNHLHWEAWTEEYVNGIKVKIPYVGIYDIHGVNENDFSSDPPCGLDDDDNINGQNVAFNPWGWCPTFNQQGFGGVTFFDNVECKGNFTTFEVDTPTVFNNLAYTNWGNRIRSIHVTDGMSVKVFPDINNHDLQLCIAEDKWDLDEDYYNNAYDEQSYTHIGWEGDNSSNMISMITVYDNRYCTGPVVQGIEIPIGGSSGIPVQPGDTVSLWANPPYTGTSYGWHDNGNGDIPDYLENKVTSVGVLDNASVALFDGPNQTGPFICISSNEEDLSDNILSDGSNANDRAESVVIFSNDNCDGISGPDLVAKEVFVSITTGTTNFESLNSNEPAYFDWHFENVGNSVASGNFNVRLFVNNIQLINYPYSNVPALSYHGFDD